MKSSLLVLVAAMFAFTGCDKMGPAAAKLSSDDDKTLYAIGFDMGGKMKSLSPSKNELAALKKGIDDAVNGKKSQVDIKKYTMMVGDLIRKRMEVTAKKEKVEADKFMKTAEAIAGAQKAESGMVFVEKAAGSGATPKASDNVKVHYHGTLRDGSVFDSSKDRGQPATFRLDRVIKCWTEGVQKMKVGGKAELYCPASVAYGDRGAQPKIPGGAALKFEVELLEIVKDDGKGKAAPASRVTTPGEKATKPVNKK